MTINERIALIIREMGLNNNSFAKTLNVSPTVTFNIISGRNTKPSYELLEKIVFAFDNISAEWLLRENGPMFKKEKSMENLSTQTLKCFSTKEIINNKISTNEYDKLLVNNYQQTINALQTQLETANRINEALLGIVAKKIG